jgi:hypothetical protein
MTPYHFLYICPAMGDPWHQARAEIQALLPYSHENLEAHCPPPPEYIFLAKMFKVTLTPGATTPHRVSITRPYSQPQPTLFTYTFALNIILQLVVKHPVSAPQQAFPIHCYSLSISNSVPDHHQQYALGVQCLLQPHFLLLTIFASSTLIQF